ncbi:hypothetical protein CU010_2194 [Enterococcus faecium]|nr:hypothetical protein [Enterococcus faecium]
MSLDSQLNEASYTTLLTHVLPKERNGRGQPSFLMSLDLLSGVLSITHMP